MKHRMPALLMLALHLAGCTTWKPATVSPRQLIEEEQPVRIRVTHSDGKQLDLVYPHVEGDTLTAMDRTLRKSSRSEGFGYEDTVRVALGSITAVETRQISVGRTTFAVGLGVALFALVSCFPRPIPCD